MDKIMEELIGIKEPTEIKETTETKGPIEKYEYSIEYTKIPCAQIKKLYEDINFFSAEERYITYEKAKEVFDKYRVNKLFYRVVLKRIDKDENNNILNTFELESWKKEN